MAFDLDCLFQKSELIPVIIQDAETKDVLMLGFTNREAQTPCCISAPRTGPPATPGRAAAFLIGFYRRKQHEFF